MRADGASIAAFVNIAFPCVISGYSHDIFVLFLCFLEAEELASVFLLLEDLNYFIFSSQILHVSQHIASE